MFERAFPILCDVVEKRNKILFCSYPDFSDNALALCRFILDERPDIVESYQLIWICSSPSAAPADIRQSESVSIYSRKSAKGLLSCLRARYVFHTHGYFPGVILRSVKNQTIVNLWHGCGYKTIPESTRYKYYGDYNIVTGEAYRAIHSKLFSIPESNILPFGLPRNDDLLFDCDARKELHIDGYDRVYVWLPTFRKATSGFAGVSGVDGVEGSFGIGSLTVDDISCLSDVLEETNSVLLIKPHPMDSVRVLQYGDSSRIRVMRNEDLAHSNVRLYQMLSCADVLLSDYSSVIIDYMLLNRPIVLTLSDFNEYSKTRGFVFDDISYYLPGPIISSVGELARYLSEPRQLEQKWEEKRKELTGIFHEHLTGRSCERVCDYFFGAQSKRS